MKLIDAQPVFKRGNRAVWMVEDIPVGVRRYLSYAVVDTAFASNLTVVQDDHDRLNNEGRFAAVEWADLQPRTPIPRGRESMSAQQWGTHRDQDGVCTICGADDSLWCDSVVHRASAQPERGQDIAFYAPSVPLVLNQPLKNEMGAFRVLVKPMQYTPYRGGSLRTINDRAPATAPPWGAWMPGTEGGIVDAATAARIGVPAGLQVRFRRYAGNATLAQDVWRASDGVHIARCVAVRGLRGSAEASPELVERVLVAMGAASGEDVNRSKISPENRALWAAALRARVQASAERERNRVVVDREIEDWE